MIFMDYQEKIEAVFEGALSPETLTDKEMMIILDNLFMAICDKIANCDSHSTNIH